MSRQSTHDALRGLYGNCSGFHIQIFAEELMFESRKLMLGPQPLQRRQIELTHDQPIQLLLLSTNYLPHLASRSASDYFGQGLLPFATISSKAGHWLLLNKPFNWSSIRTEGTHIDHITVCTCCNKCIIPEAKCGMKYELREARQNTKERGTS